MSDDVSWGENFLAITVLLLVFAFIICLVGLVLGAPIYLIYLAVKTGNIILGVIGVVLLLIVLD